ncbi:uncharacterized protein TNCV_2646441 [Trichonephila clavipes]|nr:uncharacterized protein TNCV_2646441 [Trichonephila clavipes]
MTETSDTSKTQTSEKQLNQPNILIAFDPNNSMQVISWLKYFNDKCQKLNLDDSWKITNISNYLKNSALTDYINCYDKINNWEEFTCFLTEKYVAPSITSLNDFTQKTFNGKEITQYFHEKLEIGRQLNLPTSMIVDGLTDGLPIKLRKLLTISPPSNPTEWIVTTIKLLKIQNSD